MDGKFFSLICAAAVVAHVTSGCASPPVAQTTLAPAAPAQSSPVIQAAQAASSSAPELSAAIFDSDPRFDNTSKNDAAAARTAWPNGYLVRAVVTEARPFNEGSVRRGVLQVTHVYSGPQKLVGQTFSALSTDSLSSLAAITWPQLKLGEQSIWSLSRNRHPTSSRTVIDREIAASGLWKSRLSFTFGEFTPATEEKRAQLLAEAKALAEPVERIERAAPAEQEKLLRAYAIDPKREVYEWAAYTLVRWESPGVAEFFEQQLDDKTLPIQKQAFFDRSLADVAGQTWQRSPQRLQMLERWMSADLSKDEAQVVQNWLFFTIYAGKVDAEKGFALYKTFLLNSPVSAGRSSMVYGQLGRLAGEKKLSHHAVFHFMLHQAQHAPDLDTRLAAASALQGTILSPTEAIAIKAAQRDAENQLLKGFFQSTLDFSAKADEARRRRARNAKTAR